MGKSSFCFFPLITFLKSSQLKAFYKILPSQVLTILGGGYITVDQLDSPLEDDDDQLYSCRLCGETFTLSSSLKKYERLRHGNNNHSCFKCKRTFKNIDGLKCHIVAHNDDNDCNSRNKRQTRYSSPQASPSGLQSGGDGPIRRPKAALNTFGVVKIFPSATVLKDL
ncbi:hypothetical protein AVEN_156938-1 [Araneus ventricosus]|uniref:C2H2-type domain-containing protein n=1 Tax=Araneus ventricosus TaxID=182803 RepID=A0A4Y2H634_ARAVE|nr:hypothetical protein AVEN_156938-1 [Araneus ventricosus]